MTARERRARSAQPSLYFVEAADADGARPRNAMGGRCLFGWVLGRLSCQRRKSSPLNSTLRPKCLTPMTPFLIRTYIEAGEMEKALLASFTENAIRSWSVELRVAASVLKRRFWIANVCFL